MHDQWLLYLQDPVVDGLGSFLSGCLMQLAKYTLHNHCLFSLSATRVTTLWSICFCCVGQQLHLHNASSLIVGNSKWQEERDWHKNGSKDREPKRSYYPVKWAASLISMREEQRLAKQRKCMTVLKKNKNHSLAFSEMFKTSLNFVNVRFAILLRLLTLHCTWPTVPKHVPCF